MESVDWEGGWFRGNGGNGFDILVKRTEKNRRTCRDRSNGERRDEKKGSAIHIGGRAGEIWVYIFGAKKGKMIKE